jgi:hypothetical protein
MLRKLKKRDVLLANGVYDPNCAVSAAAQADDRPPRSTKITLQGPHLIGRHMKMLLEKSL